MDSLSRAKISGLTNSLALNGDIDNGTQMAKVIAITGDMSNQHNFLSDQSGSLGNFTVKFHLGEASHVQVHIFSSNSSFKLKVLELVEVRPQVTRISPPSVPLSSATQFLFHTAAVQWTCQESIETINQSGNVNFLPY